MIATAKCLEQWFMLHSLNRSDYAAPSLIWTEMVEAMRRSAVLSTKNAFEKILCAFDGVARRRPTGFVLPLEKSFIGNYEPGSRSARPRQCRAQRRHHQSRCNSQSGARFGARPGIRRVVWRRPAIRCFPDGISDSEFIARLVRRRRFVRGLRDNLHSGPAKQRSGGSVSVIESRRHRSGAGIESD